MEENLSYAKGPTHQPLASATLVDLIDETVKKYKHKRFILSRHQNRSLTFGEAVEDAENLILGLRQMGLRLGDKIGIISHNSIETILLNLACLKGGFVLVNLCPALQYRELEYNIKKSKINCLISLDAFRNFRVIDILKKIVPEIENSENGILNSKNVPKLKFIVIISDIQYKGTFNYETIMTSGKQMPKDYIQHIKNNLSCNEICNVSFTSGTTGNPKIVGVTHRQFTNVIVFLSKQLGLNKKEIKFIFYLPMYHLFGQAILLLAVQTGSTLILPSYYYNPEENFKAIIEENCNFLSGPPAMFADLIELQKERKLLLSPEFALTGASLCSEKLFREIKEILNVKNVGVGYGATETLVVTAHWLKDIIPNTYPIGNLLDHVEAKVVDSSGNMVPIGSSGELCLRGYSIIKNYLYENSQSQNFDEDGWNKSGDMAYMDKNKNFYISGRLKEIINRGGENICPAEIEHILESHPNILEAGVVGSNDKRLGEEVCACLRIKPGSTITLNEVKDFCKGKLTYFKIPSRILVMDSFPKTNFGKLQRGKLLNHVNNISNENSDGK